MSKGESEIKLNNTIDHVHDSAASNRGGRLVLEINLDCFFFSHCFIIILQIP